MPYMKVKRDDEICVYKKGEDDKPDGETLGCHPSEEAADRQISAIWASENKDVTEKAYPNEHAARIHDPGGYDSFARKNIAPGVDIILGIKDGKSEAQAYRFDKDKFTAEEARKWLKDNDIEYMSFEPAAETKEVNAELSVFKQADGKYRWVAFTASAYLDRDSEIVSQAALENDAARMNATKEFGSLDWWHTPIQLGDCDFSAMDGRISIESGIFTDDFIGERMAMAVEELAASRGFYHPVNEPDAEGVYKNIETFSRALLPRGKESNMLTRVFVSQEGEQMLMDKIKELVAKLGGDKAAEERVNALLAAAGETDKAAEAAGLKFKEAEVAAPATVPEPKEPGDKPWFVSELTPDEFDKHLAEAVATVLAPVVKEIGTQIATIGTANVAALKESGASVTAQFKTITEAQAELNKRLADLEGLTPRGFRASSDPSTITTDAALKAKVPQADPYFKTFIEKMTTGQPA